MQLVAILEISGYRLTAALTCNKILFLIHSHQENHQGVFLKTQRICCSSMSLYKDIGCVIAMLNHFHTAKLKAYFAKASPSG